MAGGSRTTTSEGPPRARRRGGGRSMIPAPKACTASPGPTRRPPGSSRGTATCGRLRPIRGGRWTRATPRRGRTRGSRCRPRSTPTCSPWTRPTPPGSGGWSDGPSPRVASSGCAARSVTPPTGGPGAAREAVVVMLGCFTRLLAEQHKAPADNLLSDLIAAREDELMSPAFLIRFAGYENTVRLIGNPTLARSHDPGTRDGPSLPVRRRPRPRPLPRTQPPRPGPRRLRAPLPRSRHPLLPGRPAGPRRDRDRPGRPAGAVPRTRARRAHRAVARPRAACAAGVVRKESPASPMSSAPPRGHHPERTVVQEGPHGASGDRHAGRMARGAR